MKRLKEITLDVLLPLLILMGAVFGIGYVLTVISIAVFYWLISL